MRTTSLILGLVTVLNASTALNAQEAVWKTQGVTKDEIVLGMHADLSGVAASFSVGVVNSIRMRIDEVNESGGINGRKLRLVVEDTGYQVPKAIQAANKLINRDGVFAMIGNLGTGQNNAVMPEQLKAGIPNIFPISWADSMSKPFHPLKFALYAPYSEQIRVAVKYMVEKKGKKTVCAMYQDTDYRTEVFNGAKAQLDAMGMKFAEVTTHKPTDQDFTPQLTKLRAANCDLIAMGTIVRDTVIPYSSASKMGWTSTDRNVRELRSGRFRRSGWHRRGLLYGRLLRRPLPGKRTAGGSRVDLPIQEPLQH
jgi:branched-chain amino acid transport system substrate-binding protein